MCKVMQATDQGRFGVTGCSAWQLSFDDQVDRPCPEQEGDVERERDSASSQASGEEAAADCILLGACGPSEVLPQNPELPVRHIHGLPDHACAGMPSLLGTACAGAWICCAVVRTHAPMHGIAAY